MLLFQHNVKQRHLLQINIWAEKITKNKFTNIDVYGMITIAKDYSNDKKDKISMKFGLNELASLSFVMKQMGNGNNNFDFNRIFPEIIKILSNTNDKLNIIKKIFQICKLYSNNTNDYVKFTDTKNSRHVKGSMTKAFRLFKHPLTERGKYQQNFGIRVDVSDNGRKYSSPTFNFNSADIYGLGVIIDQMFIKAFNMQLNYFNQLSKITNKKMI